MPVAGSKPSISASSWFRVCSRSSLATTAPDPERRWPMASSSSTKMIAGARLRASSKRSRTVAAPTPTNISTKLDPVTEKNGTWASPATARARSVLPVPGGPDHEDPPRGHRTGPRVTLGLLEEVDHLADLELGTLVAGHVGEGGLRAFLVEHLRFGLSDAERALQTTGRSSRQSPPEVAEDEEGKEEDQPREDLGPEGRPGRLGGDLRHRSW